MKNYTQLTYSKRIKLEALFSLKMTKNEVAAAMGISLKTVYNEWNRGPAHDDGRADDGSHRRYQGTA